MDARTFSEKELTGLRREAKEPEPSPQVSEGEREAEMLKSRCLGGRRCPQELPEPIPGQRAFHLGLCTPGAAGPSGHPSLSIRSSYHPTGLLHFLNQACPLPPPGFCSCRSLSLEFPFPSCPTLFILKVTPFMEHPPTSQKNQALLSPGSRTPQCTLLLLCSAAIVSCLCTCLLHWAPSDLEQPHPLSHLRIPGVQHRA